jgi:hypothetical protein
MQIPNPVVVHALFLLNLATLKSSGAKSLGAIPSSHLDSQNGVFLPSPIAPVVEQKKLPISIINYFQELLPGPLTLIPAMLKPTKSKGPTEFFEVLNPQPLGS